MEKRTGKFTQSDFINDKCSHSQYYSQYVTEGVKSALKELMGLHILMRSKDLELNDIDLSKWGSMSYYIEGIVRPLVKQIGETPYTIADGVLILKEAAKIIISEEKYKRGDALQVKTAKGTETEITSSERDRQKILKM